MRGLLAVVLWIGGVVPAVSAVDLYVAPAGNDAHPGTKEKPFATLERARDAIRALKAKKTLSQPIRVHVADGMYRMTDPLVLEPQDSGTPDAPITYQAEPGARPVFTGGRVIRGWKRRPDGVWTARVPEVAAGQWYFEQLFVNGRRATRARTPNKFYFYIQQVQQQPLDGSSSRRPRRARQIVCLSPADFQVLAKLRPDELRDVNFMVYHKWDN
ncbi:MAG: hypothetical protein GXP27_00435, partial [Planctomycetes bacterium]|nr:hypothetical protein [Planctomycetota bacterium]